MQKNTKELSETAMADETQHFFQKIIVTNEEILKLRNLLYGLKLRALNAQILSANSGSFAVSYGVVAVEIIRFNEKIQRVNESLANSIGIILGMACELQKISKRNQLILLSIQKAVERKSNPSNYSQFKSNANFNTSEMDMLESQLQKEFSELHLQVKNSIKLCLEGRTVSLQTRIESATIIENQKLFLAVAESFDTALNIIESSYRYLIKLW